MSESVEFQDRYPGKAGKISLKILPHHLCKSTRNRLEHHVFTRSLAHTLILVFSKQVSTQRGVCIRTNLKVYQPYMVLPVTVGRLGGRQWFNTATALGPYSYFYDYVHLV